MNSIVLFLFRAPSASAGFPVAARRRALPFARGVPSEPAAPSGGRPGACDNGFVPGCSAGPRSAVPTSPVGANDRGTDQRAADRSLALAALKEATTKHYKCYRIISFQPLKRQPAAFRGRALPCTAGRTPRGHGKLVALVGAAVPKHRRRPTEPAAHATATKTMPGQPTADRGERST
jgi:hypothetical protein